MKGDIIDYDSSNKVLNLKPGSVIKVIAIRNKPDHKNIGDYILRTKKLEDEPQLIGVAIQSNKKDNLGSFWYSQLDIYKFEIIKET